MYFQLVALCCLVWFGNLYFFLGKGVYVFNQLLFGILKIVLLINHYRVNLYHSYFTSINYTGIIVTNIFLFSLLYRNYISKVDTQNSQYLHFNREREDAKDNYWKHLMETMAHELKRIITKRDEYNRFEKDSKDIRPFRCIIFHSLFIVSILHYYYDVYKYIREWSFVANNYHEG